MSIESDVVVQHIIESADNVVSAYEVHHAFPRARWALIERALTELESRLRSKWGQGDITVTNQFKGNDIDSTAALHFLVGRSSWPSSVRVGYASDWKQACLMSVGVKCNDVEMEKAVLEYVTPQLDAAVCKHDRKHFAHWPWYYFLPPPYDHWNQPPALKAFAEYESNRQIAAVEHLFLRLDEILETADPYLRSLASSV